MKVSKESNIAYAILFIVSLVMAVMGKASYYGLILVIGCYLLMCVILYFMGLKAKKKRLNQLK